MVWQTGSPIWLATHPSSSITTGIGFKNEAESGDSPMRILIQAESQATKSSKDDVAKKARIFPIAAADLTELMYLG